MAVEPSPRPQLTRRPDFESFWAYTLGELSRSSPELFREVRPSEDPALRFERVSFGSLGGVRIRGYALGWSDGAERPLVVHAHGYDGRFSPMWHWARAGVNVLGLQVRGYGLSGDALPSRSPDGYVLTGIGSPEEHVLRGAVCDYARAVEVGRELFGALPSRTVLNGSSFAGGLAVMAEALLGTADLLAVAVPSLGWAEGRRSLVLAGSGSEINRFLDEHPEREEGVMGVLSYFDPMNFAPQVRCPALVGVGLKDDVVPAPTVYAIADRLGGPCEVVELPVSHTDLPQERLWEGFEARWLRLAAEGVPAGFGETKS